MQARRIHLLVAFLEILASTYGPGPYGSGPLNILTEFSKLNAPGPYWKCTLLQEQCFSNMALEHISHI